jgi:hypothetical protein
MCGRQRYGREPSVRVTRRSWALCCSGVLYPSVFSLSSISSILAPWRSHRAHPLTSHKASPAYRCMTICSMRQWGSACPGSHARRPAQPLTVKHGQSILYTSAEIIDCMPQRRGELLRGLHKFEEPQLLHGNGSVHQAHRRFGAIDDQGFVRRRCFTGVDMLSSVRVSEAQQSSCN